MEKNGSLVNYKWVIIHNEIVIVKIVLDLSICATKSDATVVDTSNLAIKRDFVALLWKLTVYNKLNSKVNDLQKKIPDATILIHINQYNPERKNWRTKWRCW